MSADFSAFFKNVNIFRGKLRLRAGFVVLLNEVSEMQRAGQPCGSSADNQNIGFELFTLNGHEMAYFYLTKSQLVNDLAKLAELLERNSQLTNNFEE